MAYENRENSGIMFRNDRKEPTSRQPDWKGSIDVEGTPYELAAWVREGKRGEFLSIKISRPRQ